MQAKTHNYDTFLGTALQLLAHPIQRTTFIVILDKQNIIHIYKMFLHLFHCKESKTNHLITVVLRVFAVGKARGSQNKLTCNSIAPPFSCTSEHPLAEGQAEFHLF